MRVTCFLRHQTFTNAIFTDPTTPRPLDTPVTLSGGPHLAHLCPVSICSARASCIRWQGPRVWGTCLTRQMACRRRGRAPRGGVLGKWRSTRDLELSEIFVKKLVEKCKFFTKIPKSWANFRGFPTFSTRIFQKIIEKVHYLGKFSKPPTIFNKMLEGFTNCQPKR